MTPSGSRPSRPSLPQRLPASLTYNDLNGREATEILVDWFRQLLKGHYLMQPHLTLPMAVLDLQVKVGVDMYVGGTVPVASPPDHIDINGSASITNNIPAHNSAPLIGTFTDTYHDPDADYPVARGTFQGDREVGLKHTQHDFAATVNAAPVPGGLPPDQIREQHGLPVPRPGYGSRDTGSHLFLADIPDVDADVQAEAKRVFTAQPQPDSTGGRRGDVAEGYVFSSEPVTHAGHQTIPVDNGRIEVRMDGEPVHAAGISVSAGTHVSSKRELGDQKGHAYESVNGVLDAGPRGLMRPGRGAGGLYTDGRPRLSFGNGHRGS